jgi:hypothetical protein
MVMRPLFLVLITPYSVSLRLEYLIAKGKLMRRIAHSCENNRRFFICVKNLMTHEIKEFPNINGSQYKLYGLT